MAHPLVEQLRFTRGEFLRCLDGLSPQDACVRHGQMNCISWTIGHLADHENRNFVFLGQGKVIQPELRKICSFGCPPSDAEVGRYVAGLARGDGERGCFSWIR